MSAAHLLAHARINMQRMPHLGAFRPHTEEDGYHIQRELVRHLCVHFGGDVIGYKIACTNELARKLLNADHPFFGHLLAGTTHASGATLDPSQFFMRVMESEFAFQMARDLSPAAAPHTREQVADAVGGVLPGIEIVDSRYDSWTEVGVPSLIADNDCHGAWVRGSLIKDWRAIDLAAQQVKLLVNGEIKGTGTGEAVLGHPLNALHWLVNAMNQRGMTLKAGQYVTTGVTTDIYMAQPGDQVQADFGAVGAVEVSFL